MEDDEGYYHRIANGEIFVACGTEVLCINCAIARGIATRERPVLKESRFAAGPREAE
jgi:hypothetical protein